VLAAETGGKSLTKAMMDQGYRYIYGMTGALLR
jgi:hypothetical protein